MYGWICPRCGGHLDPGERCDCDAQAEQPKKMEPVQIVITAKKDQKKKTALPV